MPELRWVVTPDLIDPDRWARAIAEGARARAKVQARNRRAASNTPRVRRLRIALGVMWALLLVILLTSGGDLAPYVGATVAVPLSVGALVLAARLLGRLTRRQLAARLRETPALREAFELVADDGGMRHRGATLSTEVAWSRIEGVEASDDTVVFAHSGGGFTAVPHAALQGPQSIDEVVAQLQRWIDAARHPTSA